MINTKELLEASTGKKGVLAFGRMNPPTIGHAKLIDSALKEPGDKRIYVSHTQDNKKNPLSSDEKIGVLHKMYPNHKHFFRQSSKEEPTIFHAAARMHKDGVKHLTVVAGDDRVKEFTDKLNSYNGKFDANGNGYKFDSITVKSSGARDPDADGAEGMSASKMREAASKGDKTSFYSGLHTNLTHQDKDELMKKVKDRVTSKNEAFEIGDYVTNGFVEGEILNIHPKYATVVSEGKEHRIWVRDLDLSENKAKRDQLYKDAFIFKGYKTKHFTRQLAESFKTASKESVDEYAVLACLKAFDYILGVTDTTIMENFNVVRVQIERLNRYAKKIDCPELVEDVISVVEEELIKYAILEDIRYTTTDRMMVAKVIALTAGINIQSIADPVNTINQAAIKLKTQQLTIQGWALLGRMMNVATRAGIKWNKDIFAPGVQKEMRLI